MYQVYEKKETALGSKRKIGEYKDYDKANEKVEAELAKTKDFKYVIEETTGHFDSYGELISRVIDEN